LIKHVGINDSDIRPIIAISNEEERWAVEFLRSKGVDREKLVIGIHPGARIKTRCWPLEKFSKVTYYLKQRNAQVIIFIDPDGYGQNMQVPEGYIKAKVNLREFIALVKKLDFLVCNDGGAMHMATAVDTPVMAIFGPTNPVWFGPCGEGNTVVIREDVPCRPCFDYCRHKEPYCLTSITEEQVIKQVDVMVSKMER
jgi:ADP-heptose:LPS heptosyltransferase